MNEKLNHQVLEVMADLIDRDERGADLLHRIWQERIALIDALRAIRDWDMMSSEVRSFERIDSIVDNALRSVGEVE